MKNKVSCPYTLVYRMLLKAQHDQESIPFSVASKCIQTTPGLMFAPGTTAPGVLRRLEGWKLIQVEDDVVRVNKR